MGLADELQKLEDLRRNGTLTEAEFAQAKAAVLTRTAAAPAPASAAPGAEKLGEHLAAVRYQNELERIDREWAMERERYMITGKHGRRYIPTVNGGIIAAVVIGAFGAVWTATSFAVTSGAPDFGGFGVARVLFPLFGVVFTVFGIGYGVQAANKATAYTQAHAAYQRRRSAVRPESYR
ncbi:MAG TPA: SHOCT domain-containing protein [Gemmata sp.]